MATVKLVMNRERAVEIMDSLELQGEQRIWSQLLKKLESDDQEIRVSLSDNDLKDRRVYHALWYITLIRSDKFDTQKTVSFHEFSNSKFEYK